MAGLEVNSVNAAQGANGAKELKPQEEQKIGTVPVGQGYGAASGGGQSEDVKLTNTYGKDFANFANFKGNDKNDAMRITTSAYNTVKKQYMQLQHEYPDVVVNFEPMPDPQKCGKKREGFFNYQQQLDAWRDTALQQINDAREGSTVEVVDEGVAAVNRNTNARAAEGMATTIAVGEAIIENDDENAAEINTKIGQEGAATRATVQKEGQREVTREIEYYNLDMILSVGYRVKSDKGVIFRKWATQILKDYMLKGYAVNQKRLEYLEKTIKLIDIANRMDERLEGNDAKEILKVIGEYSKALDLLDDYDHKTLKKIDGSVDERKIEYKNCIEIINRLRFNEESTLFAVERDRGLESIIGNIYQSFAGKEIYKSVEEKGANFLYLIVKNHVFADGNKRIAATLFIYFLNFYGILYKNGEQTIDNNTLAALTLLIAESNPKEKDVIIDLVMNFLNN